MKLPNIKRLVVMGLSAGVLAIGMPFLRAQTTDSEKINKLFTQIKKHAVLAEDDADVLASYTHSNVSWVSHSGRLRQIKEHANDLIKDFNETKGLRDEGSAWQKDAIDEIQPLLQGMAGHLSASIDYLNKHQNQTRMPAWRDYIRGNREYTLKTANLIRDYVDYGESKAKADMLAEKLEVPPSPGNE